MSGAARLGRQPNRASYRISGEYRRPRSGESKRTSPPGGNPPPTQPCPRRASLPPASFPGCRQYGDANVPWGPWARCLERDPESALREIRALKAYDFERPRIDDHAVIASSRLDGNVAFENVLPDELGIALPGIAPATSTAIPFSRWGRSGRRPGRPTHWQIRHRLLAGLPILLLRYSASRRPDWYADYFQRKQ